MEREQPPSARLIERDPAARITFEVARRNECFD